SASHRARCAAVRALPPRALGRPGLSVPDARARDPAGGAAARGRRCLRRDDVAATVPACADGRARARRALCVRGLAVRPGARGTVPRGVERARRRRSFLERRPDLELRPRSRDYLVDELARSEPAAEVGGPEAGADRFEARLANRATCALPGVAAVREQRRAGE